MRQLRDNGFSIVEAMLGVAVFGLLVSAFTGALIYGQQAAADSGQRVRAAFLAEEALEAIRNMTQEGWNEMTYSQSAIDSSGSQWEFSGEGTDETIGLYTRTITFTDVCRDTSDNITSCPGDYTDVNTKQVTSNVTWTGRFGTSRQVELTNYLTEWSADQWEQTDWAGGDSQSVWSDETKYDSDDGNIERNTSGEVTLAQATSSTACGTQQWHFNDSSQYTFDSAEVEFQNNFAQLLPTTTDINFEVGSVSVDENFTTVNLAKTYTTPVIVAVHKQSNNTLPISVRIDNVSTTSFDVRLQHADTSESTLSADTVYYMVMEEGTGTLGSTQIEAHRLSTTTVASSSSWTGDAQSYENSYSSAPLVFHSIMSNNNSNWITSWVSATSGRTATPTISGFQTAMNGAQAYSTHGAAETVGWIAMEETASDSEGGVDFESSLSSDSLTGYGSSATFSFNNSYSSAPIIIGSQQAMDGSDGSWLAINSVSTTQLDMYVDEDQVSDTERNHTTEQAAWAAFGQAFSAKIGSRSTYSSSSPTVQPNSVYNPTSVGAWEGFSETATKSGGSEIYYQLSDDGGSSWQWWNGSSWVGVASSTDYNTAATIDANISSFSTSAGQLTFRAFLVGDGTEQVKLDTVSITCSDSTNSTFDNSGDYTYDSAEIEVTGSVAQLVATTGGVDDIENTVLDSLEYNTSQGSYPSVVNVAGDIYAIAYTGPGNDGWLTTVEIDPTGNITSPVIDSLEYNSSFGAYPSIIQVDNDTYAIAYTGPGNDGWLATVGIDSAGNIDSAVTDTLEFDTSEGREPDIISIDSDTYAIAYRGPGADGWLATVGIDSAGNIDSAVTDTLEFNTSEGRSPSQVLVDADTIAIAYRGPGADGWLATVDVDSSGNLASAVTDSFEYDATSGLESSIINVDGEAYAIAYRGASSDGFLTLIDITDAGDIASSVSDTLEYDTADGRDPFIFQLGTYYYGIAYRGPGSDGWVKTVQMNTGTAYPSTEPTITPATPFSVTNVDSWTKFTETATKSGSSQIYYQLSDDNGSTWRYWDGDSWAAVTGSTDYNTASDVNTNIASFNSSTAQLLFKAFLVSDGTDQVQLSDIAVDYRVSTESRTDWPIATSSNYTFNSADISVTDGHAELKTTTTNLNFEVGSVTTDENWTTVSLTESYLSPVIVATHIQSNNTEPASVRIRNVTGTSFDIRLQHAASPETALATDQINYIVMEEGSGTIGSTQVEAHRVTTSTTGSSSGGYTGDSMTYDNTYSSPPIVLHQMMSYNDSDWASTFVSSDGSRTSPPTTSGFALGINRAQAGTEHDAETLGWIAIAQTSGDTVDSTNFETQITSDSLTGNGSSSPFSFSGTYSTTPLVIASQQEMDGSDGSWAVINSVSSSQVDLYVDEETIGDSERAHTTETAAFAVFDSAFSTAYGSAPRYPIDEPTISPTSSFSPSTLSMWSGFAAQEATTGSSAVNYQISDDNGSTWQYWDGSGWTTAGSTDYNTASQVDQNLDEFSTSAGQISFRAFLKSNGIDQAELGNVRVYYLDSSGTYQTSGQFTSSGYDMGDDDSDVHTVEWDATIPTCSPACSIEIEVEAAPDDGSGSPDWSSGTGWYGTSGSGDTFDTNTGELISTDLNGNRWLRYRATLTGDGSNTPTIEAVRLRYHP